jgi:type IV secretory pathway TrbD component
MPPLVHEFGWMLIVVGVAWALLWKGIALWKAARLGQSWWFVALLLINTLGLLEILYLFVFSRRREKGGDAIA